MTRYLIHAIAFKAGWLACVLGAANGMPWLGPVVVPMVIIYHLATSAQPNTELRLILAAGAIGLAWESSLITAGVLNYGTEAGSLAPAWIVAMWLLFGTALNVLLRWLKGRFVLAGVVGAVAGPLAFVAGERLGAVVFPQPVVALLALAIGWAMLLPLLMSLSQRLDGRQGDFVSVIGDSVDD